MLVMGLDPSLTATGIVVLRDGKVEESATTKNRPELGTIKRVSEINKGIGIVFQKTKQAPDLIVIEGFSYASKGRSVFDTAYLGWRIREELEVLREEHGIPWLEVPPTQVKKFATGQGNASKDIILQQVYKRWGYETHDNNVADAFVLAKIGQEYLDFERPRRILSQLPDFQWEVIASLKGEPAKKRKKVTADG